MRTYIEEQLGERQIFTVKKIIHIGRQFFSHSTVFTLSTMLTWEYNYITLFIYCLFIFLQMQPHPK